MLVSPVGGLLSTASLISRCLSLLPNILYASVGQQHPYPSNMCSISIIRVNIHEHAVFPLGMVVKYLVPVGICWAPHCCCLYLFNQIPDQMAALGRSHHSLCGLGLLHHCHTISEYRRG